MQFFRYLFLPIFFCTFLFGQKSPEADSLIQLLETETVDSNRVKLFAELCWELRRSDTDLALAYGQKADSLSRAIDFPFGIGKSANNIGVVYWTRGDYPKAIEWLRSSIPPYRRIGMERGVLAARVNLGMLYTFTAQYDSAAAFLLNALDQARTKKDSAYLRPILTNLGNVYLKQEEYEKGIPIFEEALSVSKAQNTYTSAEASLIGLGICLQNTGENQKALSIFRESYRLAMENGNMPNVNNAGLNLAAVFQNLSELDSMLYYSQKSLKVQEELGFDELRKTYVYGNIGKALQLQGRYAEAENYLKRYEAVADTSGNLDRMMKAHQNLHELYESWERPSKAYFHLKAYGSIRDSIFQENKAKDIAELEIQYQTAEQARQIAERDLQLVKEADKRKQLMLGGALVLAALLLVFGYLYQRSRFLAQQRFQEEQIRQKELRLQTVISTQEDERARIARDLHDGVGQLLASSRLHFGQFEKQVEDESAWNKSIDLLSEANSEVRRIAHEMLPRTLAVDGLAPALNELVHNTLKASGLNFSFDVLGQERGIPKEQATAIYRIAQELLQNIVKHAHATDVQVQLLFQKSAIQLLVEDDGKGLPTELKGSGMGMENIHMRSEAIGGNIQFENKGKGLIVRLRVPVPTPQN